MAGSVEFHWIDPRHLGEPVEQAVPRQGMRPFVAEHLDGLWLTKIAIEQDQESLFSPKALAQNGFGVPESSNDHGKGWKAIDPEGMPKLSKTRAIQGSSWWRRVVCFRSRLRPSLRHTTQTLVPRLSHEHWYRNWGGRLPGCAGFGRPANLQWPR